MSRLASVFAGSGPSTSTAQAMEHDGKVKIAVRVVTHVSLWVGYDEWQSQSMRSKRARVKAHAIVIYRILITARA